MRLEQIHSSFASLLPHGLPGEILIPTRVVKALEGLQFGKHIAREPVALRCSEALALVHSWTTPP